MYYKTLWCRSRVEDERKRHQTERAALTKPVGPSDHCAQAYVLERWRNADSEKRGRLEQAYGFSEHAAATALQERRLTCSF